MFLGGPPTRDPELGLTAYPWWSSFTAEPGGRFTSTAWNDDPEPEEFLPDRVYGEQGRCGRLVLDMAQRLRVVLSVYDVRHPQADRNLVATYVHDGDDLPVLVRQDGTRLVGEESFVPRTVGRFLRGD